MICPSNKENSSPYMALTMGTPIIKMLGREDTENPVMTQSNLPLFKENHLSYTQNMTSTVIFCIVSASMSLPFILYGLLPDTTRNDRNGIEILDTNLLIPEQS